MRYINYEWQFSEADFRDDKFNVFSVFLWFLRDESEIFR